MPVRFCIDLWCNVFNCFDFCKKALNICKNIENIVNYDIIKNYIQDTWKKVFIMKKVFITFSVLIITLLCSITVFAMDTDDSGLWEYQTYGTGVILTQYKGIQTDVYVPNKITKGENEYSVLKLGDGLFKGNTSLNSATLGEGITEIGASAFEGATSLVCIVTPESLSTIGDRAFLGCTNFNSVILYDAVTNIGANAFTDCVELTVYCNSTSYVQTYVLENGIKYENTDKEAEPEFHTVDSVKYYICGGEAIAVECLDKNITSVNVPAVVKGYPVVQIRGAFENCKVLRNVTLPSSLKLIELKSFSECRELKHIDIPEGVWAIGNYAFNGCRNLENVVIPDGVTYIGHYSFANCHTFTEIIIPDGVTYIGQSAYYYCYQVKELYIPESVETIENHAFYTLGITKVKIPDKVKSLERYVFANCTYLEEVIIPEGVTTIKDNAFKGCTKLAYVILPKSLSSLSWYSFSETMFFVYENSYAHTFAVNNDWFHAVIEEGEIPQIVIENDFVYYISNNEAVAISYNGHDKQITIPDKVNGYPLRNLVNTFKGNISIEKVIIPDGVTTIGDRTFSQCSSLTEVVIPDSVTSIGIESFYDCRKLSHININKNITQIGANAFYYAAANDVYIEDLSAWCNIDFGHGVSNPISGGNLYLDGNLLTTIVIPESVTVIKPYVFNGYSRMTSVRLHSKIESIGIYAFSGCTGIESIQIPGSITKIENYVFSNCTSLQEVTLSEGLRNIGEYAFSNCQAISNIIMPSTLTTIAKYAFSGCTNLTEINLNDGLENIREYAFKDCSSLVQISIPKTIKYIVEYTFDGCSSLEKVNFSEGLLSVYNYAFTNCTNLITVKLPSSLTSFSVNAFPTSTILLVLENSNAYNLAVKYNLLYYVVAADEEPELYARDGVLYFIKGNEAVAVSFNLITPNIVIPEKIEGYNVTDIGTVFKQTQIESIVLPNTITKLQSYAFYECKSLKSIKLPETLTSIGNYAISYCSVLENLDLPESITYIGEYAFAGCFAITKITIPKYITTLNKSVLVGCRGLKEIVLPDNLTSIGERAFDSCTSLEVINLPQNLKSMGPYCFEYCQALENIVIPESVTQLGERCFYRCSKLKNVQINAVVATLPDGFFYECTSLETVKVPDGVTMIGGEAFYGCEALNKLLLPETILKINAYAFRKCDNLKFLRLPASVDGIFSNAIDVHTILLVTENSYGHLAAKKMDWLYFVIHKVDNPEVFYGAAIKGSAKYTDGSVAVNATVDILYDDGTVKETVPTDANGNYEFTYAEVGRYTIRVTDALGNTAREVVSVKRMNVFDVYIAGETNLVLKKGYNVSGTITPAPAKITISDTNGNIIKSADVTDGTFTFSDIPRGSYIVKAENSAGSATTEIYVSNEDVTGISLAIQTQSATITGDTKIENRDGTFSAKIWVNIDLINEAGNVIASTKTDADGKYTFNNVPAGSYNIVATANEMRPDIIGSFDKIHELKGYGHIDVTGFITYTVDAIILRENKINLTSVSGKVTANGTTQDCQVILTNENGDQIAVFVTESNGKYNFINIPDGMYCVTAITKVDGMGFAVITIENGVIHGDTDIKVAKADKISKREPVLLEDIPDCNTKAETLIYKEAVMAEKRFYDSLSEKERKQLSKEWIEKLFKLISLISDANVVTPEGVTVENEESILSHDEIEKEEKIEFVLSVSEAQEVEVGDDGIKTTEEYEGEKIKDKKGKDKEIAKYYDISLSKNGENISNIQKQTETNGKLRITMDIPEEYRGYKHYSFIHMHKGEAVTLVDLDDDPNTATFEIDKFSTFALAYSDVELIGEVEETIYPASIIYNAETGQISVSSTETGKLYIATYEGKRLLNVMSYDVVANTPAQKYDIASNQAAFVWNENLKPLCGKFTISN